MERLLALLVEWQDLRAEVRQSMAALDQWIIAILALLLIFIAASRLQMFQDAVVAAVIAGSVGMVWIGRNDVLIHRPVPAIKQIEAEIDRILATIPADQTVKNILFRGWESHYKAEIKRGVKILIPLDAIAGILIFALFMHANNSAYNGYLAEVWWRGYLWWTALSVHLAGWAIIAGTKKLAE